MVFEIKSLHTTPLRSPEAKKRKAVTNGPEAVNGPESKKAKKDAESSSSDESSDEDDAPPAKTPAAGILKQN